MKSIHLLKSILISGLLFCLIALISCNSENQQKNQETKENSTNSVAKRVGMIIKIDSTRIDEYLALHADSNPGVRDLLEKYHMKNFSIFMTKLEDGNY